MSIIITKDEFASRKNCFVLQENIVLKYKRLIDENECFSKVTYFYKNKGFDRTDRTDRVDKRKHMTSNDRKHHHPKKTFTSLWNLLNESNYTKVCHRLKFMISDDNVNVVIKELINMAITHSIYRKYFILILKDVIKTYEHTGTFDILNNIIVGLLDSRYLILENITLDSKENYDMFCDTLKHKQKVLNTYIFILDIIDQLGISIPLLIEKTSQIFTEHLSNEYYFDLMINIMIIIAERYPKEIAAKVTTLRDVFTTKCSSSKKSKFLIEKIILITQTVQ